MSSVKEFIAEIKDVYASGNATEHSYRPAIQNLINGLGDGIQAINEPKRIKCGAPDFIVSLGDIAIGHIEAKDIDSDLTRLKGREHDQKERYLDALPNLIYTNGLDWMFYRDGKQIATVSIGDFLMGIQPKADQFAALENKLQDFVQQRPRTITSPQDLAQRMAGKARLIKDVLQETLKQDKDLQSEIANQYRAFQGNLIRDIKVEDFADIYAETVAYGMFGARLHDQSLDTFTRQEALELLPKSNPFLRNLFTYIAGPDLDERIAWIIDDLAHVFRACDLGKLMEGFGTLTGQDDPFLHFYETFLAAYNPEKRKACGVWYTPEPVVNFIVRAVDQVLQDEFGLPDGLADTSKVTIDWDSGQTDNKSKKIIIQKEVHRVQVLDPATGTGTFLAEVLKQIAPKVNDVAPAMWHTYVENDLIPRLHGFELLMASYAMCHTKLDMVLTELGYRPTKTPPRLGVYLTNSLEEGKAVNQTLPFAQWLSNEAKGASTIKRDMPIMCVIGNPPYSGISKNKGKWITNLIENYKYVDGVHFGERKHWLNDDYVKFIRMSSHLIEKNGEGILGFITNHGYLDNPTFRGMRWHLLNSFDKIYVLDLHGNANKKEVTPEGAPDKNVFDIRQGVAIIIAVKKKQGGDNLAQVYRGDLWGARESKYDSLKLTQLGSNIWTKVNPHPKYYMFYSVDHDLLDRYDEGFSINEFMPENVTGIVTARDSLVIDFTRKNLENKINRFIDPSKDDSKIRAEFFSGKKAGKYLEGDTRGWKLSKARIKLQGTKWVGNIQPINYRPFDTREILYQSDMVDWGRFDFMRHMLVGDNLGLITPKISKDEFGGIVTNTICGHKAYDGYDSNSLFPLYLYPDDATAEPNAFERTKREVNFNPELYTQLQNLATHPKHGTPDEIATFDYIYGILHCPAYRTTYAEFLKIDFPRIPWPCDAAQFWDISAKGAQLRKLHLMQPDAIGTAPFNFVGDGDHVVGKPAYKDGRVWINKTQYFDSVPKSAWEFFIGGYQPAQKWLKDRKGCVLSFDDVRHYQNIIKILSETDRIMGMIEMDLG